MYSFHKCKIREYRTICYNTAEKHAKTTDKYKDEYEVDKNNTIIFDFIIHLVLFFF
jgi:cytidylate kinase